MSVDFIYMTIMKYTLALIFAILFATSFAQDTVRQNNQGLWSIVFKMESKIEGYKLKILKLQADSVKCCKTISTSESILAQAEKENNTEAKQVALAAIQKATFARMLDQNMLKSIRSIKSGFENALVLAKNEMSANASLAAKTKSVISNYSGSVQILKVNPIKNYYLDTNTPVSLESGDIISTGANSKVYAQFLEGRGNMAIGESTKLKITMDSTGTEIIELKQGKIKLEVDKIEEQIKEQEKLLELVKNPYEKNAIEKSILYLQAQVVKKLKKRFEVRTISCVVAIRGTQLVISEDSLNGSSIIVLEGSVEIMGIQSTEPVIISEGYKTTVTKDGQIAEPQSIDLLTLEKWWEK